MKDDKINWWFVGTIVLIAAILFLWVMPKDKEPDSVLLSKAEMPAAEVQQPAEDQAVTSVVSNDYKLIDPSIDTEKFSPPTQSVVDTNVPEGYKRIQFSVVGTGFATQPQTNLNK